MALVITVVTILAVLPVLYADDNTASVQLTYTHTPGRNVLNGCDDCYTAAEAIQYHDIYMDGQQFGAFAVGSNGNVLILQNTNSPTRRYRHTPKLISRARGSPMIAPLWQDNDLRRRSGRNRVLYEQTCNRTLLAIVRSYVGQGFNPQSAVVVTYDRVYKYLNLWQRIFSRRRAQNTYQLIIATDPSSCQTYVIFDYDAINWSKGSPTVGYTDGEGNGFQLTIQGNNARTLCNTVQVFRIDQTFSPAQVEEAKMNGGEEAKMNGGSFVYMQQGKEDDTHVEQKDGDGDDQAYKAEDNQQSLTKVFIQDFGDKENALEELDEALLQQFPYKKNVVLHQ